LFIPILTKFTWENGNPKFPSSLCLAVNVDVGDWCTSGGQRPAHINMWTSNMLVFEGTNAVLFCRAEGNPSPTVTWFDPEDRHITSASGRNQYLASVWIDRFNDRIID